MRFNYLKGLISSSLFCSLYVNAAVFQYRCENLISIYKSCKEDINGFISELVIKENAYIEKGLISCLEGLQSIIFSGEQKYIGQSHLEEISTLESLREFHLTDSSFISNTNLDFSVFEGNSHITILDIVGYDKTIKFRNAKEGTVLDLKNYKINQVIINKISKLKKLYKLKIQIDDNFRQLDISSLKSMPSLKSLEISCDEIKDFHYNDFKSIIEGFVNLTELHLDSFKLSQDDIIAISSLIKLTNLSMTNCDFSNSGISSLNNLKRLRYFTLTQAQNIKGQTLINKSLKKTEYDISHGEFCISQDMEDITVETRRNLKFCKHSYISSTSSTSSTRFINYSDNSHHNKISINGLCGRKYGKCPAGECCSKYGLCGNTIYHCGWGWGCQKKYGKCEMIVA